MEGTISFAGNTQGNKAISDWSGKYAATNLSISGISSSYTYAEVDAIRLSSSTNPGNMTITFAEDVKIQGIKLDAKAYGSDTGVYLTATTSAHSGSEQIAIGERGIYTFSGFENDGASRTLSFSAVKKKRVVIYGITLTIGGIEAVYPDAVSVTPFPQMEVGDTRKLQVSVTPATANVKEFTYESSNISVATVSEDGVVTAKAVGNTRIYVDARTKDGITSDCFDLEVVEAAPLTPTELAFTEKDIAAAGDYIVDYCPTEGNPKLLIIPVWFSDSDNYINPSKKANVRADIEKAYVGTAGETGWHSVSSYYEEESKGEMFLEATVSEWYDCGLPSSDFYADDDELEYYPTDDLVPVATDWYFEHHDDSRTNYDSDGNGLLDGVMLIYGAPDCQALGNNDAKNLWAYCYWLQDKTKISVLQPGPNAFFWASYDFMYSSSTALNRAGTSYASGDTSHCTVDAHTFIHEMGHVLGLDDYYDYGDGNYCHAGGFSMQDYNVGGHDPYSVMAYGWADPYIPTKSASLTISAFQKNHDLILLTPEWNANDSPFDEYLLIELYTPTGLNEFDSVYRYQSGYPQGPSSTGIRLWHVDARLAYYYVSGNYLVTDANCITTNPYAGSYGATQAFTNTMGDDDYGSPLGSSYQKYHALQLLRNDTSAGANNPYAIENGDLFGDGSSFSMSQFSKQFPIQGKMNSNKNLGWSFSVTINGSGHNATATIDLVKA